MLFDSNDVFGVLDIGGDASGARVLARYRQRLVSCGAHVLCVINANRPATDTPEKAIAYIRDIEYSSGLQISGLVNNTHLCKQTEFCDIILGAKLITEISVFTNIPILCHVVPEELAEQAIKSVHPVFPIKLYMKKPWE